MSNFPPVLQGDNYVCIHGHFYQPPRENPFTGQVERVSGLGPYADWNQRINDECYRPNTQARILDASGLLLKKVNTYEWISFDFGPTLAAWLEEHDPTTYRAIIDADRWSARNFAGHGSAMAQSYNHTILPLSNSRDKRTQIRWGIADFAHRHGRLPEGMWLPETAVDLETLEILADEGIVFTVLSPHQAEAVRGESGDWEDVIGGRVDTRVPYRVDLTGGKQIAVFFYNGPLSQEIAFNGLLDDGHLFAKQLIGGLGDGAEGALLSNVATDGESYGHHHRFGEMALAAAIEEVRNDPSVSMTNYGEFLELHPPTRQVRIAEHSSWSCSHGVERWRADCGCAPQGHPDWNQAWRGPLRDSLDWLRDSLIPVFEAASAGLFSDPWAARDGFIEVILEDSESAFLDRHARRGLEGEERARAIAVMEIQRHAMLMYTSCGWFFDDIGRLEGIYVLRHAGRVVELTREVLGQDLEPGLLDRLDGAASNTGGTARDIYLAEVAPFMARS